jgi:hypothetical protein
MPSVPLKQPADLASYTTDINTAHLTVFFNTQSRADEHLLVVFGTNNFGGVGELANLRLSEAVFNAVAAHYPLTNAVGLTRSPDFSVSQAQQLLEQYWPVEPAASEEVSF